MRNGLLLLLMLAVLWGRLCIGSSSSSECGCGENCCCAQIAAQAEEHAPDKPPCPCDCGEKAPVHLELLPLAWEPAPAAHVSSTRTQIPPVIYRELTVEEGISLRPMLSAARGTPPHSVSCALPALYSGFDSPLRA